LDWLNYHHLLYFWTVVREGGFAAASRKLHVGRPSISMQVKSLEAALGQPLLERRGRHIEPTETGRLVLRYAEEIFLAGRELLEAVRGQQTDRPSPLRVGVADVLPKVVAFRLLEPALAEAGRFRLECREESPRALFAELAAHQLDLVLSDVPIAPGREVRAYNHLLGESSTTLFGTPELAERLRADFPASLDGAPLLMPGPSTAVRRDLELWFEAREVAPLVVAEFEDSALLKVFGRAGHGLFPAPTLVATEVAEQYGVEPLAELAEVRERFYAVTAERRVEHPALARILADAPGS
jgi:LysR family transcriptional activator of nhaA